MSESLESLLRLHLNRSDRAIRMADASGRQALQSLARTLEDADRELAARIKRYAAAEMAGEAPFTALNARGLRAQLDVTRRMVEQRLEGLTLAEIRREAARAYQSTGRLLVRLERQHRQARAVREAVDRARDAMIERDGFANVAELKEIGRQAARRAAAQPILSASMVTSPDVLLAARVDPVVSGIQASRIRIVRRSYERYGERVTSEFERRIRVGLASGKNQSAMVDDLIGVAADEERLGPFAAQRYWPARVVRTEVAHAQNAASDDAIRDMSNAIGREPLKRKILAVLDKRTAWDSVVVHGQVRAEGELFRDGAGREYERPPARPNDRETIVPWRDGEYGYDETDFTEQQQRVIREVKETVNDDERLRGKPYTARERYEELERQAQRIYAKREF